MPPGEREEYVGDGVEHHEEALSQRWPWLLPLAAGIFLGAAVSEMLPEALNEAGRQALLWTLAGLALFAVVRGALDRIGRRGLAWVATLGIWLHSFLEGAITATSYGVSLIVGLLVSVALILHLVPEVGAVIILLTAAGLSLRQALTRNVVTWAFIVVGFMIVYLLLPSLPAPVLGAALAVGAGGFLYLAYVSFQERRWPLLPTLSLVVVGVLLMFVIRLAA